MQPRFLGIVSILSVSLIWIAASFVVKHLETTVTISPYLITFLSNACFVVLVPISCVRRQRQHAPNQSRQADWQTLRLAAAVDIHSRNCNRQCVQVGPLMWSEQFLFNLSLEWTSVSSNTILSSTASLFTFVLSLIILKESFHWQKMISLVVCFTGVVLVAVADSDDKDNGHPLWGDAVALVSALIYSFNTVLISKCIPEMTHADTLLLFGFGGIWQLIIFGILGGLLTVCGMLSINFHLEYMGLIVAKGMFDNVLTSVLWIQSVLIIGPTAATMGLALQWPLAIGVDAILGHDAWWSTSKAFACSIIGCLLILVGFVGINLPEDVFSKKEAYDRIPSTDTPSDEIKSV